MAAGRAPDSGLSRHHVFVLQHTLYWVWELLLGFTAIRLPLTGVFICSMRGSFLATLRKACDYNSAVGPVDSKCLKECVSEGMRSLRRQRCGVEMVRCETLFHGLLRLRAGPRGSRDNAYGARDGSRLDGCRRSTDFAFWIGFAFPPHC